VKFGRVVFEIFIYYQFVNIVRPTDRHADHNTSHPYQRRIDNFTHQNHLTGEFLLQ